MSLTHDLQFMNHEHARCKSRLKTDNGGVRIMVMMVQQYNCGGRGGAGEKLRRQT